MYVSVSTQLHVCLRVHVRVCGCMFLCACVPGCACTLVTEQETVGKQQVRALQRAGLGAPRNGQHCVLLAPIIYPPALPCSPVLGFQ